MFTSIQKRNLSVGGRIGRLGGEERFALARL